MWVELQALGLLKKEEKEEAGLLEKLQELADRLIEDISKGTFGKRKKEADALVEALNSFIAALQRQLRTTGLAELQIRNVNGRIQLAYERKREYVELKEFEQKVYALLHLLERLVTLENETFEKIFDNLAIKETANLYRLLLNFKVHVQKLANLETRAVESIIEEDIKYYFLRKPEKVNVLANLLLAHGGRFIYSRKFEKSGVLSKRCFTFFIQETGKRTFYVQKEVTREDELGALAELGAATLGGGITSSIKDRRKWGR